MAVDIARFLSGIESPVRRIQEGIMAGQNLKTLEAQEQAAIAQADIEKQKAKQQQELQRKLNDLANKENRTIDDFNDIIVAHPDLAKAYTKNIEQLEEAQKQNMISEAANVFAALGAGNTEAAIQLMEDRKQAAINSNDKQEERRSDVIMQAIKTDPKTAMATTGLFLASSMGDKFPETFKALFPAEKEGDKFRAATPEEMNNLGLPAKTPGVQINERTGRAHIPGKGVSVNVGDGSRGAAATTATKYLTNIIERGDKANELLNTAELLDSSLDQTQGTAFSTGFFGGLRTDIGRAATLLGLGEDFVNSIANAENIGALSSKLTIMETQALKGSISNKDMVKAESINTSLGNSQLGNRFATKRLRAMASMNKWQSERFEQLDEQNPDASDKELSRRHKNEFSGIPYISSTIKDRHGLPLFFTEFRESMLNEQPDITTKELIEQWRAIHRD